MVREVEKCASSELYPLLKREDEKYVTERAYDNPKFVEDVLRDVVLLLRNNDIIDSLKLNVSHWRVFIIILPGLISMRGRGLEPELQVYFSDNLCACNLFKN